MECEYTDFRLFQMLYIEVYAHTNHLVNRHISLYWASKSLRLHPNAPNLSKWISFYAKCCAAPFWNCLEYPSYLLWLFSFLRSNRTSVLKFGVHFSGKICRPSSFTLSCFLSWYCQGGVNVHLSILRMCSFALRRFDSASAKCFLIILADLTFVY